MIYGPLSFYEDSALVATAVDPRFGVGAVPTQPDGWAAGAPVPSSGPQLTAFSAGLDVRNTAACAVVCLGSSTTAGSQATTEGNRYVNLLAARTQSAFPLSAGPEHPVYPLADAATASPLGPGVAFANGGQGNTTSANYLPAARVTQVGTVDPRMVIHMIGSNDLYYGTTLAAYKTNLQGRLDALRAAIPGPCSHVYVHAYERWDTENFTPVATWREYGQALAEFVADNPYDCSFIDLDPDYRVRGVPGADPLGLINVDNVHQGNVGHAFMADLLAARLGIPPA